jgi:hypothetical protein
MLKFILLHLAEKIQVLRIAARPASFNIGYPQIIKFFGDLDFVVNRKGNALALGAIPQGSIVDLNVQL